MRRRGREARLGAAAAERRRARVRVRRTDEGKINGTGAKYGLASLALCERLCKQLSATLQNARDFAVLAAPDVERAGRARGAGLSRIPVQPLRPSRPLRRGSGVLVPSPRGGVPPRLDAALAVVLTSGTLSPTDSLEGELGAPFPVKVEAPHVVPARQIHVEATDALGDFTAKSQASERCVKTLGALLVRAARHTPGGMLVFLPKYSLVTTYFEEWARAGTLAELEKHKDVVLHEEPGAKTLGPTLESFRRAVRGARRRARRGVPRESVRGARLQGRPLPRGVLRRDPVPEPRRRQGAAQARV